MKTKLLSLKKLWMACLISAFLVACQEDEPGSIVPSLDLGDYVNYETAMLAHMNHFGAQIRNSGSPDFDDESLKSISSAYFSVEDHAAFADAIDNADTEAPTGALKEKVDHLHTQITSHTDHISYLSYLNDQLNAEFSNDALAADDQQALLNHIVHLRVSAQFLAAHQDLFFTPPENGRTSDVDWWLVSGQCGLEALGTAAATSATGDDISTINEGKNSAKILGAVNDAKANCNSKVFLKAFKFFEGIQTSPYEADGQIYNMYSYSFIKCGDGRIVDDGKNPPIARIDGFPIPADAKMIMTNAAGTEGPYIGITAGGDHFAMTDCSGFVSYILAKTDKVAYDEIAYHLDTNPGISHLNYCPSASQYANFTPVTNDRWTKISDFDSIIAGDIIAWDEETGKDEDSDTGHVMIAAGPSRQADGECYYLVDIFDATLIGHLDNDRNGIVNPNENDPVSQAPIPTGVGIGTIALKEVGGVQESNFYPNETDCGEPNYSWHSHPNITILRLNSSN